MCNLCKHSALRNYQHVRTSKDHSNRLFAKFRKLKELTIEKYGGYWEYHPELLST